MFGDVVPLWRVARFHTPCVEHLAASLLVNRQWGLVVEQDGLQVWLVPLVTVPETADYPAFINQQE